MADAAASKAAEATHVGSTPTFPTRFEHEIASKIARLPTDCPRARVTVAALTLRVIMPRLQRYGSGHGVERRG